MDTFLWAVIIVMALALAGEIFAIVGLGLTARRAMQRFQQSKQEVATALRNSNQVIVAIKQSLQPRLQVVRYEGKALTSTVIERSRNVKAVLEDFERRRDRIRIRFQTDGGRAFERLRSGRQMIQGGAQVLRVVSTALWILRRVA